MRFQSRFLALTAAGLATLQAAEMPVKEVVLYKHGIGYFLRSGDLAAGEGARLSFRASEMNDVLKSLTIAEAGGGKVTGVRYDSSDTLAHKLQDFPFALGDQLPLTAFLDRLKGARVEVRLGTETIAGAVVSGRTVAGAQNTPQKELLVLLTDNSELRTIDLSMTTSVKFSDPTLQLQFKDYLTVLASSRSKDLRNVYIDSTDNAARRILASYILPTPIWKSSYRLVFPETGEPTLEGWAIIDNTTGEDWTNVRLSVVSGRPISFISQLYEPKYITRPTANLADEIAQGPIVHQGAVMAMAAPPAPAVRKEAAARRNMAPMAGFADAVQSSERLEEFAKMGSSAVANTEGREAGELFEYRFSNPVTVKRNESAMLPFLQQKLGARKLLIYSGGNSLNPTNAAELTNSTGKTLDGGPITVYDAGTYAGEALMDTVKQSDKRLISYGVDQGTRITTNIDSGSETVRDVKYNRGMLSVRTAVEERRTYSIRNVDAKAKTLIIEHPIRPNYKLVNMKPLETTSTAYRFEVKLAASSEQAFKVTEENLIEQIYSVSDSTPDFLLSYVQNKNLSDAARKQIQQVADLKNRINELDNAARQIEQESAELNKDQQRVRENLSALNRVSGQQEQVARYANELAKNETTLATLRDRLSDTRKRKSALESELSTLIQKLEF